VLIAGDLSMLNAEQRISYYRTVCESLALNPLTKPFEYIQLNGKLVLYAKRDCTDQLRQRDAISITITAREVIDDIYVVTVRARRPDGREDESTGAVNVAGLKGEAKANAFLKCETKAKRRVTLSICGLGMLDETEVVTVPGARPAPEPAEDELAEKLAESIATVEIAPTKEAAKAAQAAIAARKIELLRQTAVSTPRYVSEWPADPRRDSILQAYAEAREALGEVRYEEELRRKGIRTPFDLRYLNAMREFHGELMRIANAEVVQ
jgi:hypothetical protein